MISAGKAFFIVLSFVVILCIVGHIYIIIDELKGTIEDLKQQNLFLLDYKLKLSERINGIDELLNKLAISDVKRKDGMSKEDQILCVLANDHCSTTMDKFRTLYELGCSVPYISKALDISEIKANKYLEIIERSKV